MSFKRLLSIITIILIVFSISGCTLIQVNEERDRKTVIAEVEGEQVLKGEFLDLYNNQKQYMGITETYEKENKEYIQQMKESIVNSLVDEIIILKKAEESGFKVDDEALDTAKQNLDDMIAKSGDTEVGSDEFLKAKEDWLEMTGMDEQEYIQKTSEQTVITDFKQETLKDVTASEGDINTYYNEELKKQQDDPATAETAEVKLYRPEGFVRVKHILVKLPENDEEKTDDEAYNEIKPKAEEVLDKAKSGEDFDELIEEYGEDPGMEDNEDGYILNEDSYYVQEFKDVALALENEGDISELVKTDIGYHIIKLMEKLPEKTFAKDEVREDIDALITRQKRDEQWSTMVEEWRESANVKVYKRKLK